MLNSLFPCLQFPWFSHSLGSHIPLDPIPYSLEFDNPQIQQYWCAVFIQRARCCGPPLHVFLIEAERYPLGCSECWRSWKLKFWIPLNDVLAISKTFHPKKSSKKLCPTKKWIIHSTQKWIIHSTKKYWVIVYVKNDCMYGNTYIFYLFFCSNIFSRLKRPHK